MELLLKYFPELNDQQLERFASLEAIYQEWNQKINVISRKDTEAFNEHHLLHSLAIGKLLSFEKGTTVLDIGTGGGFPGIPLAILFPDTQFHLVDSIAKKIKVVNAVKETLELENVKAEQRRAEEVEGKYDFIVSRAVTRLNRFLPWVKDNLSTDSKNTLKNGMLFLKGGDLKEEISEIKLPLKEHELKDFYEEEYFETKKILYLSPFVKTI